MCSLGVDTVGGVEELEQEHLLRDSKRQKGMKAARGRRGLSEQMDSLDGKDSRQLAVPGPVVLAEVAQVAR